MEQYLLPSVLMAMGNTDLKQRLLQAAAQLEHSYRKAKVAVKEKLHRLDPLNIMPYYGFGNETCVYLKGRVLEKEKVRERKEGESTLRHLKNTYRRYESDEIPGMRLRAEYGGKVLEVRTDDEGFFDLAFCFDTAIDYQKWGKTVKLRLLETKTEHDEVDAEGILFVPHKDAEFGIISDIDDTVMVSDINNFLGRLRQVLLKDASERSPFPGIAAFLRALCTGYDNRVPNPLFYVSGSEWNLFDLLVHFFQYHDIPEGPLFLRDKGTNFDKGDVAPSERAYKHAQICRILDTYPHLKFILIGDSGQHDPEIYHQVVFEYPGRILGIYIRDVSGDERDKEVLRLGEEVKQKGVELLLTPETLTAARHAVRMNWINQHELAGVEEECRRDDEQK